MPIVKASDIINRSRVPKENVRIKMIAKLPLEYENYVFDLYGTLVDIHTDENIPILWEKLALFYGFYGAVYQPEELKEMYGQLVKSSEGKLKLELEKSEMKRYSHEASPEIQIEEVFLELFRLKNVEADMTLAIHAGQFFRVLSLDYVRTYPGTQKMLENLKNEGKKVYLLSNAQRIFTLYEMKGIDIFKYFDDILISSDYKTRKPDIRFFQALIDKHNLDASKTLFIGNDSTTDIKGASMVGFSTYYVNSNISPENDMAENANYIVKDFDEWN